MDDRLSLHFPLTLKLGITAKERAKPQTVDCFIWYYADAKVARTDELSHSSDYARIVVAIEKTARNGERKTIERLAEDIAATVLSHTQSPTVTVSIEKQPKDFPGLSASITIDRSSKQ